ncbi:MAG: hypothetical protein KDA99_14380, partial [Planctomycetales bacterium]|nr:hypothetical protein [Planctomycetales bacterium]
MGRLTKTILATGPLGDYTWNSRNELTAVDAYNAADPNNTTSAFSARDLDFAYDHARNRTTSSVGGGGNSTYATNNLNQYLHIDPPSGPNQVFAYDADRNMTSNGTWTFTYDAENRVTAIEPAAAPGSRDANDVTLEFKYDHLNRRVEKKVTAWDPTLNGGSGDWESTATTQLKYGYDGDELVIEYNGLNSDSVERRYRWALGKLWWMRKLTGARYMMMRDIQDNVTMLFKRTGLAVEGIYEYDAMGNVLSVSGAYGDENPMRWRSMYNDTETGFRITARGLGDPATSREIRFSYLFGEASGACPMGTVPLGPGGCAQAIVASFSFGASDFAGNDGTYSPVGSFVDTRVPVTSNYAICERDPLAASASASSSPLGGTDSSEPPSPQSGFPSPVAPQPPTPTDNPGTPDSDSQFGPREA